MNEKEVQHYTILYYTILYSCSFLSFKGHFTHEVIVCSLLSAIKASRLEFVVDRFGMLVNKSYTVF